MRSFGQAPIQYDWCPYKNEKFRQRDTQREDGVKMQGEDGHLHPKTHPRLPEARREAQNRSCLTALRRDELCSPRDLGLLEPGTRR